MTKTTPFEAVILDLNANGVAPSEDAVIALERWRRGGLRLAAVSARGHSHEILRAAGLESAFDAVIDGEAADDRGVSRAPGLLSDAAARLVVEPRDAVAIGDSVAGLRSARALGFGLVVGVTRETPGHGLDDAGAHRVVRNLLELRFPRRVPSLLEHLDQLSARIRQATVVVCLDYDGTLTPIVKNPGEAWLPGDMRSALEQLAQRYTVAIISGRDRADVEARVGLSGVVYAGSHGFDIAGMNRAMRVPAAEAALPVLERAADALAQRLRPIEGVVIERKRFGVATHYRNVDPSQVTRVREIVDGVLAEAPGLRKQLGKMVLDLQPDVDWDKGRALHWILSSLGLDSGRELVVYVGDDETDEDVFRGLGRNGLGARVGPEVQATQADYRLDQTAEVRQFLEWLAQESRG